MNWKHLLLTALAAFSLSGSAAELKVLMVGNSFSLSVLTYLPKIAEASGKKLKLGEAMIGSCTIWRHYGEYGKTEKDPSHRPYWTNLKLPGRPDGKVSLQDLLTADRWDIVTIQQASHESGRGETFEGAPKLIALIRKHQPQTEIVIQQTWSYRSDDSRVMPPDSEWGFDQNTMYEKLTANYLALAKSIHARVIPTGLAVQIAREKSPVKFKNYDPALLGTLHFPDLPPQAGDVVGRLYWSKDQKTGEMRIIRDAMHLNDRGEYLQACVWYLFLFGGTAEDIRFVPNSIGNSDARFLARCAEDAVKSFPK